MPIRNRLAGLALIFAAAVAIGQQSISTAEPTPTFDVVSIKPTVIVQGAGGGFFGSRFRGTFTIYDLVLQAYFSNFQGNQIVGMPAWARDERYDIVGHVDETTAPWWLELNPRQQNERGKPMLRKLLVDRCRLVAHLVPAQINGYALVVNKRGSHLELERPRETYPTGIKNLDADGGKVTIPSPANGNTMQFFNATIQELAEIVGGPGGSVIRDDTNLTGRYDFTIHRLERQNDPDGKPIPSGTKPDDLWDISSTGLEFRPTKIASQNLVVDHIERPTPN